MNIKYIEKLPTFFRTVLILILLISILNVLRLSAQTTSCNNIPPTDPAWTWQQNSLVRVNISPNFNPAQQTAIYNAFMAWQNSSGNLSGVRFSFTYNATAVTGTNSYQVNQSTTNPCAQTCQGTTLPNLGTNGIISATTTINSAITNSTALLQAMVHEIGHTFGLDDCDPCSSVMAPADSMNATNGLSAPSDCDVSQANSAGSYTAAGYNPPVNGPPDEGGGHDPICYTETIPGQCYEVCVEWSDETYDPYWGVYIVNIYSDCDIQCDPDQTEEVCY